MRYIDMYESSKIEDIKSHLEQRGYDTNRTALVYDKDTNVANFFLYNLSGQLIGYQRYNPNGTKTNNAKTPKELWKYFTYSTKEGSGSALAVYGLDTYSIDDKYIWITEGIFDINKIHNAGQPGIAVLTNNPSATMKSWLRTLPQKKIVVYDNDEAGKKLKNIGDYSFTVPNKYKDLGEMPQSEVNRFITDNINKITKTNHRRT